MREVKVLVWGENVHEQINADVAKMYPAGMHNCIADALRELSGEESLSHTPVTFEVSTATLQETEHGLSEARLADTDVLLWWGHCAHDKVEDEIVDRVHRHVLEGMGLIVLHSGHYSKIFKRLMGTTCSLRWREAGERERLWVVNPGHPIVQGLGQYIELPNTEMYSEPFAVPNPDEVVFISAFEGGEVFRSGLTYRRGNGKIFYFRPGHETYPIYYHEEVRRVLRNAVSWARREAERWIDSCPNVPVAEAPNPIEIKGLRLHKPGEQGFR